MWLCDAFKETKGRYPNARGNDRNLIADPENKLITWKLIDARLSKGLIPGVVTLSGLLAKERGLNRSEDRLRETAAQYGKTLEEWKHLTKSEKDILNRLSSKQAQKYQIDLNIWNTLDNRIKHVVPTRWRRGIRKVSKLIAPIQKDSGQNGRKIFKRLAAKKYGIPIPNSLITNK